MKCLELCKKRNKACQETDCRMWVDYDSEFNCVLETIERNGRMTLRQIAEREGISFARVKQIETEALKKLKKRCLNKGITFQAFIKKNYYLQMSFHFKEKYNGS